MSQIGNAPSLRWCEIWQRCVFSYLYVYEVICALWNTQWDMFDRKQSQQKLNSLEGYWNNIHFYFIANSINNYAVPSYILRKTLVFLTNTFLLYTMWMQKYSSYFIFSELWYIFARICLLKYINYWNVSKIATNVSMVYFKDKKTQNLTVQGIIIYETHNAVY